MDQNEGDGGFCILRGSHKSHFPVPADLVDGDGPLAHHLYTPTTKAGDVVLFTEACVHGAMPWRNADIQRRIALYRFAPANHAYGRGYLSHPDQTLHGGCDDLTDAQRAVLSPPFTQRLERPVLAVADGGDEVEARIEPRAKSKKDFDKETFGTEFF